MPTIQRSVLVVPCYAIEDLPTEIGNDLAADFLTAWTVGWDPRLLQATQSLPEWKRTDSSSLELEDALVVIPELSREKVDQPQRERLLLGRCISVDSNYLSRSDLVEKLLETLRGEQQTVSDQTPLQVEDFYALGYAVLQIQMMARKLRYSWNLDWLVFSEQVQSAASASLDGNAEETERWLQAAFDSLSQERDRYCSQHIHLLEVILLAPSTLGESLTQQLLADRPLSILGSSDLLAELRSKNEIAWQHLRDRSVSKSLSIVGGLQRDLDCNRASFEAIDAALHAGKLGYATLGLESPKVFGQFGGSYSAILPELLVHHRFEGALLNAWSGGGIPTKDTAKIRWQTHAEGEAIDTILGHVSDGSNAETFLHLTTRLSKQLDYHHVPTLILAHWPGDCPPGFQDLLNVMKRSPALGTLETVDKYFSSTNQPYSSDTFNNRQFQAAIPESTIEQTKLRSRLRQDFLERVQAERLNSATVLWNLVYPSKPQDADVTASTPTAPTYLGASTRNDTSDAGSGDSASTSLETLAVRRRALLERIVESNGLKSRSPNDATGYLFVNPSSHPRRVFVEGLDGDIDPGSSTRIVAVESQSHQSRAVIDLPPFGFVKVRSANMGKGTRGAPATAVKTNGLWKKITGQRNTIADRDWTLANEFMELQIDPRKGHLRSMFVSNKRGSRMSGMISLVVGEPIPNRKWKESDFLLPQSTTLQVAESTPVFGAILSTSLFKLPSGEPITVKTEYRLWKGARWLEVKSEWNQGGKQPCHVVWRTAWANESATISSWQQGTKGKLPTAMQSGVELVEIDDIENKLYLAAMGESTHQKWEHRYLVTTLTPTDKTKNVAMFALGMDWPRPLETAYDLSDPPWYHKIQQNGEPIDNGAWLAQCSVPNVVLEFEAIGPIPVTVAPEVSPITADALLWVKETRGKRASTRLSFFKNVAEAWRVDANCQQWTRLDIDNGQILVNLHGSERSRIAIRWSS